MPVDILKIFLVIVSSTFGKPLLEIICGNGWIFLRIQEN